MAIGWLVLVIYIGAVLDTSPVDAVWGRTATGTKFHLVPRGGEHSICRARYHCPRLLEEVEVPLGDVCRKCLYPGTNSVDEVTRDGPGYPRHYLRLRFAAEESDGGSPTRTPD
jgi:hypothetical protein